jgi:hypothetical protein
MGASIGEDSRYDPFMSLRIAPAALIILITLLVLACSTPGAPTPSPTPLPGGVPTQVPYY